MSTLISADFLAELRDALLSVGYAFVMVHVLAYAYIFSNRNISMSIGFVRSMMLASVATSVMVLVVGRTLSWGFGLVGTLCFGAVALYLNHVPLGQPTRYDAQLRFKLEHADPKHAARARERIGAACSLAVLAMVRPLSQGEASEYVYQLRFKRGQSRSALLEALRQLAGLSDLSLMMEDLNVEV